MTLRSQSFLHHRSGLTTQLLAWNAVIISISAAVAALPQMIDSLRTVAHIAAVFS